MSTDPLETARAAHRRVLAAEAKAKPARVERDGAVMAAYAAGVRPPTIARATGLGLSLVRKIIRENKGT
jgi:signal transduction histidine kinase